MTNELWDRLNGSSKNNCFIHAEFTRSAPGEVAETGLIDNLNTSGVKEVKEQISFLDEVVEFAPTSYTSTGEEIETNNAYIGRKKTFKNYQ